MQEINAKIINQRIISSNIYISPDLSQNFEVNMECRVEIKTPKNKEEHRVLLNFELDMGTKDEELKISLVAEFIFELEQIPEDYSEIAEKTLVPMARDGLLNSLDDILVIMGYRKMRYRSN